ncbi:hypothetical protein [Thalassospira xiamenensis]|nr:hypothetical protein [Thalassospira xiamenensis]
MAEGSSRFSDGEVTISTLRPVLVSIAEEAVDRAKSQESASVNRDASKSVHVSGEQLWDEEKYYRLMVLEMASRWSLATGYNACPMIFIDRTRFDIHAFKVPEPLLMLLADQVAEGLAEPDGINIAPLQARWNPEISAAMRVSRQVAADIETDPSLLTGPMTWTSSENEKSSPQFDGDSLVFDHDDHGAFV